MKNIKYISAMAVTALVLALFCMALCSCENSAIKDARSYFKSGGFEVSEISDEEYPYFSASYGDGLPKFSFVDCKDNESALLLFEKDKEVIEEEFGKADTIDGENAVIAYGEADGLCYKVGSSGASVIFATYEKASSADVDKVFNDLKFN